MAKTVKPSPARSKDVTLLSMFRAALEILYAGKGAMCIVSAHDKEPKAEELHR